MCVYAYIYIYIYIYIHNIYFEHSYPTVKYDDAQQPVTRL